MPSQRKYDQETQDRAVRLYVERRGENPGESLLTSRTRVGELLGISQGTLRGWVDRAAVVSGGQARRDRRGVG